MAILFYHPNENYGFLSNFAPSGFKMKKTFYPTVEHYYQSQKIFDTDIRQQILAAHSPKIAKITARKNSSKIRSDWNQVKTKIMFKGVFKKFKTHPKLLEKLLKTDHEILIENSLNDYFWGIGKDKTGLNMLGKILMAVRDILR
ncbi:MAG: NADAR family protein [Desulfamplus sp.]|nr:NADAR family protein [Desulfamplus sp.]